MLRNENTNPKLFWNVPTKIYTKEKFDLFVKNIFTTETTKSICTENTSFMRTVRKVVRVLRPLRLQKNNAYQVAGMAPL